MTMKIMRNIILVVIIGTFSSGYSQDFIQENKMWSTLLIDDSYTPPDHLNTSYETYFTKFEGDTSINLVQYSKLFQSTDSLNSWELVALIREETRKIFIWNPSSNNELLLYDFNIELGDTSIVTNFQYDYYSYDSLLVTLDSTDNIFIEGVYHKRLYVKIQCIYDGNIDIPFQDIWIEGIGSKYGPLMQTCFCWTPCYINRKLLCVTRNDTLLFNNPDYNECYYYGSELDNNEIIRSSFYVNLFPNPIDEKGFLKTKGINENVSVTIYNLLGEKVKFFNVDTNTISTLDFSDVPQGFYVYDVIVNDIRIKTEKIIIKR